MTGHLPLRRSQLYRWHASHQAQYDGELVGAYLGVDDTIAQRLGLCDLSLLARAGYRGRGAAAWLAHRNGAVPEPNEALAHDSGALTVRLSATEFLIVETLAADGDHVATLAAAYTGQRPVDIYPLPRQDSHALFAVTGDKAADMLAKLCAIDLRASRFAPGAVAQTSLARTGAIVLRTHVQTVPVFYVFADVSAAQYLWDSLLDAMTEFAGAAIGVRALRTLE